MKSQNEDRRSGSGNAESRRRVAVLSSSSARATAESMTCLNTEEAGAGASMADELVPDTVVGTAGWSCGRVRRSSLVSRNYQAGLRETRWPLGSNRRPLQPHYE